MRKTGSLSDAGNWRFGYGLSLTSAIALVHLLKLSHELKRVNEPAPCFGRTDTIVSAALVAKF